MRIRHRVGSLWGFLVVVGFALGSAACGSSKAGTPVPGTAGSAGPGAGGSVGPDGGAGSGGSITGGSGGSVSRSDRLRPITSSTARSPAERSTPSWASSTRSTPCSAIPAAGPVPRHDARAPADRQPDHGHCRAGLPDAVQDDAGVAAAVFHPPHLRPELVRVAVAAAGLRGTGCVRRRRRREAGRGNEPVRHGVLLPPHDQRHRVPGTDDRPRPGPRADRQLCLRWRDRDGRRHRGQRGGRLYGGDRGLRAGSPFRPGRLHHVQRGTGCSTSTWSGGASSPTRRR